MIPAGYIFLCTNSLDQVLVDFSDAVLRGTFSHLPVKQIVLSKAVKKPVTDI